VELIKTNPVTVRIDGKKQPKKDLIVKLPDFFNQAAILLN
jgi:hypothetical protein